MKGTPVLRFVGNRQEPESEAIPHLIPPMTHPYSKYWEQPDRSLIRIVGESARMSKDTLAELLEYSSTNPTGAYEGKMWKRRRYRPGKEFVDPVTKKPNGHFEVVADGWLLCWYGFSDDPDMVSINTRIVEIEQ